MSRIASFRRSEPWGFKSALDCRTITHQHRPTRTTTCDGGSARPGPEQLVELPDHGVVLVGGEEYGHKGLGAEGNHLVAAGRIGAMFHEQASHLRLLGHDRPEQAGPPEIGRDVGVQPAVEEPAHDLGPALLAGVDERLGHDLLRIVGHRVPGRNREEVGDVGARQRGVGPQPAVRIEAGPASVRLYAAR